MADTLVDNGSLLDRQREHFAIADPTSAAPRVNVECKRSISIVVPVFNEESNIDLLLRRLEQTLEHVPYSYEIVIVDDGSGDATWQRI